MFGRRSSAVKVANALRVAQADAAFDEAEAGVRGLGETVAARIATEFRAGRIGRQGVQQRVEFALEQLRSLPAETVPTMMCQRLESVLRVTVIDGLRAAGIPLAKEKEIR